MSNLSEKELSDGENKSVETLDDLFAARVQKALRKNTESLDGHMQSRLTQARYAALNAVKPTSWTVQLRHWLSTHWIAPAGGATAAAILAIVLSLHPLQQVPDTARAAVTLDDLDMVASGDSLELYQEMDFYAWLDAQPSDDWSAPANTPSDDSQSIT